MKTYDFVRTREIIEQYKDSLASAALGMHEDWFWTAQDVWVGGEYKHALPVNADEMHEAYLSALANGRSKLNPAWDDYTKHCISGIYGSGWATPTLQLRFKDGIEKMIEVSKGQIDPGAVNPLEYGVLSGPVQEEITPISEL